MTAAARGAASRALIAAPPRLRATELFLLVLAGGVTLAAPVPLYLADHGHVAPGDLGRPLALIGAFIVVHVLFSLVGSTADEVLLPAVLVLMGLAMTFSQRLAPALDDRQFRWLLVGTAVLAAAGVGVVPLRTLRRYRYTFAVAGVVLVAATLLFGRAAGSVAGVATGAPADVGGPRLWLAVGGASFQPSEVLKILLVIFLAGYLAERHRLLAAPGARAGPVRLPPLPYLAPLAVMLGAALLLLAAQRDLGAALLLYVTGLGVFYVASGRAGYVVAGAAAFVAGFVALQRFLPYVAQRASMWLDPWADASNHGFQLVQGLMALAAGGIMGTGIGQGQPTLIPAVHTDFVYAAVAEELGLAGAAAVLAIYGVIVWRGWRIALDASSVYTALLATGLTLALAVQVFVIVGGIVRAVPLTGITLPFLSHGGTSLVTSSAAVGLLLLVSHDTRMRGRAS